MTITEFLTARLDEEQARFDVPDFEEIDSARGPGWGSRGDCPLCERYMFDGTESVTEEAYQEHFQQTHRCTYALADIAAKRAIVKEYVEAEAYYRAHVEAPAGELTGLGSAVRHIASLWASHKDYDPTWRVG